jgi:hypothetical protein
MLDPEYFSRPRKILLYVALPAVLDIEPVHRHFRSSCHAKKEPAMSTNNDNAAAAVIAFVSGAVIGAAAALLLTPKPGREVREKLSDLGENAADKMKRLAREAKFKVAPKTKSGDFQYDGGDAWI